MKKNFVLDTNVLLHDANAISTFDDNNVAIPIYVIEEIDQFKRDPSELGRNARHVSRQLDKFRKQGNLREGVPMPGGGTLSVVFTTKRLPKEFTTSNCMDDKILAVAMDIQERHPDVPMHFISKDSNLRIRADALGLTAEDYDKEGIDISELYTGQCELDVGPEMMDTLFDEGSLSLDQFEGEFHPNQGVLLRNTARANHTALGRIDTAERRIVSLVPKIRNGVWGIRPRNKEQYFALDLLLNDEIKLVTLLGKAGTGKTLLALAAGLELVTEDNAYKKLLVSRPVTPMGRDIGFLPGTVDEKLGPWMRPIYDNLEFLLDLGPDDRRKGRGHSDFFDLGIIEVEPLTYIRGRSIPDQIIIVDEAQNLTPHEVKTIITRVGWGTKIVFTGDPYQIDQPYLDSVNNGLSFLAQKFKDEPIAGTITLFKGERSQLAEVASNLL